MPAARSRPGPGRRDHHRYVPAGRGSLLPEGRGFRGPAGSESWRSETDPDGEDRTERGGADPGGVGRGGYGTRAVGGPGRWWKRWTQTGPGHRHHHLPRYALARGGPAARVPCGRAHRRPAAAGRRDAAAIGIRRAGPGNEQRGGGAGGPSASGGAWAATSRETAGAVDVEAGRGSAHRPAAAGRRAAGRRERRWWGASAPGRGTEPYRRIHRRARPGTHRTAPPAQAAPARPPGARG